MMSALARIPSLCRLGDSVTRREYFQAGAALLCLKYALEAAICFHATGSLLSPRVFFSPWMRERFSAYGESTGHLLVAALVSLPFVWVGVVLSVRRFLDAAVSGWWALWFLLPFVNVAVIAVGCLAPTRDVLRRPGEEDTAPLMSGLLSAVVGLLLFCLLSATFVGFLTLQLETYGYTLFLVGPVLLGAVAGAIQARTLERARPALAGFLSVFVTFGVLGAVGLEGVLCLAMALPPAFLLAVPAAHLGAALARRRSPLSVDTLVPVLALPLFGALEARWLEPLQGSVTTAIKRTAEPAEIWPFVVAFPPLAEPTDWLFRSGIAYPTGATIEGQGVGAVRRCSFSTGDFVEPITVWDEPRHLAFDVAEAPDPMRERMLFEAVRPPHLDLGFRSRRGEFRLVALPDGGTRLEGTTWYAIDLHPAWYWQALADPILHRIHRRVLEHIARQVERRP